MAWAVCLHHDQVLIVMCNMHTQFFTPYSYAQLNFLELETHSHEDVLL